MTTFGSGCLAAVLAVTGASALAQQPDVPASAPVKEKKICRRLTPTGSFMATRVCNTRAEWAAFDGHNAAGVNDFRRALNMSSTNERGAQP